MDEPDEAELREIYAALTIGEPDDPALADRVLARAARMPEAELPQRLESTIEYLERLGFSHADQPTIDALTQLRDSPNAVRVFVAWIQETLGRQALIRRMKRLADENALRQVVLMDEARALMSGVATLASMPAEAPSPKPNKHGGTRRKYDRATLRWLDAFQPDGWKTDYLWSAYTEVTGIKPPRSWIQRHKKKPVR
jgi:hypothetical protein